MLEPYSAASAQLLGLFAARRAGCNLCTSLKTCAFGLKPPPRGALQILLVVAMMTTLYKNMQQVGSKHGYGSPMLRDCILPDSGACLCLLP